MSTKKVISLRTCLITNKKLEKKALIRLTKIADHLEIDLKQNKKGRGYYIINQATILKNPNLQKILERKTKTKNNQKIIDQLEKYFKK